MRCPVGPSSRRWSSPTAGPAGKARGELSAKVIEGLDDDLDEAQSMLPLDLFGELSATLNTICSVEVAGIPARATWAGRGPGQDYPDAAARRPHGTDDEAS